MFTKRIYILGGENDPGKPKELQSNYLRLSLRLIISAHHATSSREGRNKPLCTVTYKLPGLTSCGGKVPELSSHSSCSKNKSLVGEGHLHMIHPAQ